MDLRLRNNDLSAVATCSFWGVAPVFQPARSGRRADWKVGATELGSWKALAKADLSAVALAKAEVAGPLLEKPSGLRLFCLGSLSLLAHKSSKDKLARRSAIQTESFLSTNIHSLLTGCWSA